MTTEPNDLWHTAELDLDAYLARIGQPAAEPSPTALAALHEAHVSTIPFENVEPLLGGAPALDLPSITDKLVHRRRGGYCFEHALLFAAALDRLGYSVTRLVARVPALDRGPRTHLSLAVRFGHTTYLAEVGFGAGVLRPLPLRHGTVVDQGGWPQRITREQGMWVLSKKTAEGWESMHALDDTPQLPIDYVVANHYTATHPKSPFTYRLVVMRTEAGRTRQLVGDRYTVETPDGTREERRIGPDELDELLRELDVVLEPEELAGVVERYAGPGDVED
ncbi:arylamine N-acetyltransferase [Actinoalloteichus sp. AHMU CJ021]|uniref:N-hydroxyarylamine O-acetyltransferase n=1 Tax=Actinoalloteichus caeruleus DSM 43889 TaxID=1120930 RepID=A0ABT1JCV8_ACTCY|nr:arylamine N-acetyltransferase [Actinoalloteichus caeruleus]AUS80729.1 arylamine N-acetyltransferase [Actinoalloteichus sp. AHMU CJ021]MCP2330124.1 N-hydroxyarylamine O-acetyltransferase [Actinoalloteichus caeruleus DSM 43889]